MEEKKTRKPRVIKMQPEPKPEPQLVARIIPRDGHTLFEVDKVEMTIKPATFEMVDRMVETVPIMNKILGTKGESIFTEKKVAEVIKKPNCIYISALNAKNVMKILVRNFGFIPEEPLNKKNHGITKIEE